LLKSAYGEIAPNIHDFVLWRCWYFKGTTIVTCGKAGTTTNKEQKYIFMHDICHICQESKF